jgi:hypothetical protein
MCSLAVLINAIVPLCAQTPVEKRVEIEKLLDVGKQATSKQDFKGAQRAFQKAQGIADEAKFKEKKIDAVLLNAALSEAWPTSDKDERSVRVKDAIKGYELAIAEGSAGQKAMAQNNLGVLYLRESQIGKSLKLFEDLDFTAVADEHKGIYKYNQGRALEMAAKDNKDKLGAAYKAYEQAVVFQPDYKPAVEAAYRVLLTFDKPRVTDGAHLGHVLASRGQIGRSLVNTKRLLTAWGKESDAAILMPVVIRCYVSSQLTTNAYRAHEREFLKGLAEPLAQAVHEVDAVYTHEALEPTIDHKTASDVFPIAGKSYPHARATSRLLKMVGDQMKTDFKGKTIKPVFARYTLACALDASNTEAGLALAALLATRQADLTNAGLSPDEWVNRLVRTFEERKLETKAFGEEDWLNVLRRYVVLAKYFETKGKWGSTEQPDSVIYQLTKAIQFEKQVPKMYIATSPGIYLLLGRGFEKQGNKEQAWVYYISAAEAYLILRTSKKAEFGNSGKEEARVALAAAESLKQNLSKEQEERRGKITRAVDALPD